VIIQALHAKLTAATGSKMQLADIPQQPQISISIVSHKQGMLVKNLLDDLRAHCDTTLEVILTINVKEDLPFDVAEFGFPIRVVTNASQRGFAANHNAAFKLAKAVYFCVLNPDIRLERNPFPALIGVLADPVVGAVAPLIVGPSGQVEDSARRFPTPVSILKKALFGVHRPEYAIADTPFFPDWIAGMFLVFRSEVFRLASGFDERYFLYYEDVDLCWRLRRRGYRAALVPSVCAIHDARRESHQNARYLVWHASSMLLFFARHVLASTER
jgi:N-acetylglucosaminyl-diphospho-decaprenol L-rhamnosyltransferase